MLAHIDAGLLHSHHKGLRIDSCAALHGSRVTAAQTERRRLLGEASSAGKFFRGIVPGLFQHLAGIVLPVAEEEILPSGASLPGERRFRAPRQA